MNVILRKSDSTASLLLFIYNYYLSQYSKDTLKLSSLLEIMKAFGKSETAIRMALSRTVKGGILINSSVGTEVHYRLDSVGKEAIDTWNEGIQQFWKRYKLRNNPWNEKWYLVNLEFGDEHKKNRMDILERLQQTGLGVLNTNTWITPYYQPDEIQKIISRFNMSTGVLEMHGEINIHNTIDSFVENAFQLEKLKKKYINFMEAFSEQFIGTRKIYQEEWFTAGGHALPLLHAIGWEFFSIVTEDPALPKSLYPVWIGDEAAQLMIEYRGILLESMHKFLGKFD